MSHVTKCRAHKCPSRDRCLRWTSPASERQSYALFRMNDHDRACADFLPNDKARSDAARWMNETRFRPWETE